MDKPPPSHDPAEDIDPALVDAMRARVVKRKPQDYSKRKAGPGRPKGHPKTGGKKAGTPNLMSPEFRGWLMERARPFELLASICAGEEIEDKDGKRKPTMQERMRAAETITRKLLPDLAATALTGRDGGPIAIDRTSGLPEDIESARQIAFILARSDVQLAPLLDEGEQRPLRDVTKSQLVPCVELPPSVVEPAPDEQLDVIQIGGMTAVLHQRFPDGREWWSIRDPGGKVVGSVFGRKQAETKAKELNEAEQ